MPSILVATYAAFSDPSSGAAKALLDTLSMLRAAGWSSSATVGPRFDRQRGEVVKDALACLRAQGFAPKVSTSLNVAVKHRLLGYAHEGTPVVAYVPSASGTGAPSDEDARGFVSLIERQLDTARPDVVVTYGGGKQYGVTRGVVRAAARRRIPVVFWLRNEHYTDPAYLSLFESCAGVVVPSPFLRDYYRASMGIEATCLPSPVSWQRVLAPEGSPRDALVFVNPSWEKGACVAARIFEQLQARHPAIPILVVESRGGAENLFAALPELDRRGIEIMPSTPDPRDFYRRARVLLAPSVWAEASLRLGVEAIINGIPIVASDRGGIPQTLAEAGIVLGIPAACTPQSRHAPAAADVEPWVDVVRRLWEEPAFYAEECRRARAARDAFAWEPLAARTVAFFSQLAGRAGEPSGARRP